MINYVKLKQTRSLNSGWVQKRVLSLKNAFGYGFSRIADQSQVQLCQFIMEIHTNGCYKEGGVYHPLSNHFPPILGFKKIMSKSWV
jgi:hypothetical protein